MLKWRASGFAAREVFPDVLMGLITTDEWDDIRETNAGVSGETQIVPTQIVPAVITLPPSTPLARYPDSVGGIDTSMHPPKQPSSPPPVDPRTQIVNRLTPLREAWLKKCGIDPTNRESASKAWTDLLGGKWNAKSIKDMSDSQCDELIAFLSDETTTAEVKEVFG
jgi:hypothetical protein